MPCIKRFFATFIAFQHADNQLIISKNTLTIWKFVYNFESPTPGLSNLLRHYSSCFLFCQLHFLALILSKNIDATTCRYYTKVGCATPICLDIFDEED